MSLVTLFLDGGILISNSVLKAMRKNLEWCVLNAVSDDHGENFGRCVYHSVNLNCQQSVQVRKPPLYLKFVFTFVILSGTKNTEFQD